MGGLQVTILRGPKWPTRRPEIDQNWPPGRPQFDQNPPFSRPLVNQNGPSQRSKFGQNRACRRPKNGQNRRKSAVPGPKVVGVGIQKARQCPPPPPAAAQRPAVFHPLTSGCLLDHVFNHKNETGQSLDKRGRGRTHSPRALPTRTSCGVHLQQCAAVPTATHHVTAPWPMSRSPLCHCRRPASAVLCRPQPLAFIHPLIPRCIPQALLMAGTPSARPIALRPTVRSTRVHCSSPAAPIGP